MPAELPPRLRLRGCHPLRPRTSTGVRLLADGKSAGPLPHISRELSPRDLVWAPPLSVAPTQGIANCFLFLRVLRCFTSPRSRPLSGRPGVITPGREVPFGDPGINGCMRLPPAFRSLPRPSSVPEPRHPPGGLLGTGPYGPASSLVKYQPLHPRVHPVGCINQYYYLNIYKCYYRTWGRRDLNPGPPGLEPGALPC